MNETFNKLIKLANALSHKMGLSISLLKPRPVWLGEKNRFDYQQKLCEFNIQRGDIVLDIGSGGDPFPLATVITDRFIEPSHHRADILVLDNKPFFISAIENLPLKDKSVDFVYCAHVLEHVEDPITACAEITRVGKRGYIETPTLAKDFLFSWADGMHKWHLMSIANKLIFFEYGQRQLEGVKSKAWRELIAQPYYHPIQGLFYNNLDLFNVMFMWETGFECIVYYLDGRTQNQVFS